MLRATRFRPAAWWIAAATLAALALAWAQAGALAGLDRWQRGLIGVAFPMTNGLVIAGLLAAALLIAGAWRRTPPKPGPTPAPDGALSPGARRLIALAAALAGAAALSLLPLAWAPRGDGPAQAIDLTRARAVPEGAVWLTGWRPAGGELRQTDAVFGAAFGLGHAARYLPVIPANAPAGARAAIAIELRDDGLTFDPHSLPLRLQGVAVANALPAAVADALARRGAIAGDSVTVVFTDPGEMARGHWQRALVLLLAALVPALLAATAWWRARAPG